MGRPAALPRPTSLRDLQGDKHRLRLRYKLTLTFLLVAVWSWWQTHTVGVRSID